MAKRSASTHPLLRLLENVATPVYLVSASLRVVYLNEACRAWVGAGAEQLVGQECRYHSLPQASESASLAALLCPPPVALAGESVTAAIAMPRREGESGPMSLSWLFDFVPLAGDGESFAVLAVARPGQGALPPEPQAGQWMAHGIELHHQLQRWRAAAQRRYATDRFLGQSPPIVRARQQMQLATGAKASVLIVGPPGSGRQLAAKIIHYGAPDGRLGPLVPLAGELLSGELLRSSVRALQRAIGQQVQTMADPASGRAPAAMPVGTLLINNVERMPAEALAELGSLLADGQSGFRIVATARTRLLELAAQQQFPEELAHRLSTLVIELPTLLERGDDLALLAQMALEECNARSEKQLAGFVPEALEALRQYSWPRQIDELFEFVAEAHARAAGPLVLPEELPSRLQLDEQAQRYPRKATETIDLETHLATVERELIEQALRRARGNKAQAAKLLGLSRPRLYRRLEQLGMFEATDEPEDS